MIFDEEIIKLAKQHLEWEVDETDETWIEYSGISHHIIEFAQKIFLLGYYEGYDEGRAESEYTHSGMFGEPQ